MHHNLPSYPAWQWISWTWRRFQSSTEPRIVNGLISAQECQRILRRRFKKVEVWDKAKEVADRRAGVRVLEREGVPQIKYIEDKRDCENISFKGVGELMVDDEICGQAWFQVLVSWPAEPGGHVMACGIDEKGLFILQLQCRAIAFNMPIHWIGHSARG